MYLKFSVDWKLGETACEKCGRGSARLCCEWERGIVYFSDEEAFNFQVTQINKFSDFLMNNLKKKQRLFNPFES